MNEMRENVHRKAAAPSLLPAKAPHGGLEKCTKDAGVHRRPWTPEALIAAGDRKNLPVWVTHDEAHAVFNAAESARDRLFAWTLWVTGARVSEAIGIAACDFDRSTRTLRLRRLKKRSGPVDASVPGLPEEFCQLLHTYIQSAGLKGRARLFAFNRFRAWRIIKALMAKAGIEPVYRTTKTGKRIDLKRHPHAWRHGFAINLLNQGKPLVAVQELLGHESMLSTYVYVRALAANVRPFMETTTF